MDSMKRLWRQLSKSSKSSSRHEKARLNSDPLDSISHVSDAASDESANKTGLGRPLGLRGTKSLDLNGVLPGGHHDASSPASPTQQASAASLDHSGLPSPSRDSGSPTAAGGAAPAAGAAPAQTQPADADGEAANGKARAAAAAAAAAPAPSAGSAKEPHSSIPRDEDLGCCPPYAAKAAWGLRYTMEDKWAAVPNLVQVPQALTCPPSRRGFASAACGCVGALASGVGARDPHAAPERAGLMTRSYEDDLPTDSLHYFAVFDGHGGVEAARFCAQRMHAVLREAIQASLQHHPLIGGGGGGSGGAAGAAPTRLVSVSGSEGSVAAERAPAAAASVSSGAVVSTAPPSRAAAAPPPPGPLQPAVWLQAALVQSFTTVDSEFADLNRDGAYVGTTAVVAVLGQARLWVAHCGDSRAVISRRGACSALTSDHKASRDDEVARVQAAGGHVWWDRVMGELAVSRAIGDHCLRPYVIAEPEVCMTDRTPDDELMLLASDGLWDVLGNQEAADIALHNMQAAEAQGVFGVAAAKKAASALTRVALERGTRDNITALVVDLRPRSAAPAPAGAGSPKPSRALPKRARGGAGAGAGGSAAPL